MEVLEIFLALAWTLVALVLILPMAAVAWTVNRAGVWSQNGQERQTAWD